MALFRRRGGGGAAAEQAEAIERFWAWWETQGARETAVAIDERDPHRMVGALSTYVKAIHRDLAWELAPGTGSVHTLIISSEGDPRLRAVARRWLRKAPEPDMLWSFADSRPPALQAQGWEIDGTEVDLAGAVAGARISGTSLDVAVHHPAFVTMKDDARGRATMLLLDAVFGEDAVESWIGAVEVAAVPPLDAVPLTGLRSIVSDLASRWTGPDGRPGWVELAGTTPAGDRVEAAAQVPLKPVTAPHLDTHVAVQVQYHPTEEGMPDDASRPALTGFQAHLDDVLGDSGRTVAHETRQGVRLLHLYVDGTTPATDQLAAAVQGWENGRVAITSEPDPAWDAVAHLRS